MVTVLSLSPCIDKTVFLSKLETHTINRADKTKIDIGGKGINVVRALHNLGIKSFCVGINYKKSILSIKEYFDNLKIEHDLLDIDDYLRINTKIFETSTKEMTEINEKNSPIENIHIEKIKEKLISSSKPNDILVLTGSVADSTPKSIYKDICLLFKNKNIKIIVDAEKELLKHTLGEGLFLIKPNVYELEIILEKKLTSKAEIKKESLSLIEKYGIKYICVSMGKEGAMLVSKEKTIFAKTLDVEVKGLQGAGDSMIAGICYALEKNINMLISAAAASQASVIQEGTTLCSKKDFLSFIDKIEIEEI